MEGNEIDSSTESVDGREIRWSLTVGNVRDVMCVTDIVTRAVTDRVISSARLECLVTDSRQFIK